VYVTCTRPSASRLLSAILDGALHEQFAGGDGARFAAVVALRQGELRGSIAAGHADYIANERQGRTLGEVAMDELTAVQVLQLEDHDALSCTIQARAACEPAAFAGMLGSELIYTSDSTTDKWQVAFRR
jgi:hypothetical protein